MSIAARLFPLPPTARRSHRARRRRHGGRLGVGVRRRSAAWGGLLARRARPGPAAVGTAVLGAAAGRPRLGAADAAGVALLAVCGVAWFAIYNVALNAAEQRLDAGTTAMLVNIGPILIAVFAGLLLGEGFPRWLVVGQRGRLRRRRPHRRSPPASGETDLLGRRALRGRRGRLRGRRGRAEAGAAPAARRCR